MNANQDANYNRRDFLRGTSFATVAALMGGVRLMAAEAPAAPDASKIKKPPVPCGIIGLGPQGREIMTALNRLPNAPIAAICDTYAPMVKRAAQLAPNAKSYAHYQELLADKSVKAVFVATPTHKHREIVEAALAAGKHVYCEAPLAHTVDDARAIAAAAKKRPHLNFQTGLQRRSDPQNPFTLKYLRAGAAGSFVRARAQWAQKTSWRRSAPNPEREKELNWRLYQDTSVGLVGEEGIHLMDHMTWFLGMRPKSIQGHGGLLYWNKDNDDREVFDTVQAVIEFPNKVFFTFDLCLANSFEGTYGILYGTDAAVLLRDNSAWMFKEADAPLLGWEVYCQKEDGVVYKEVGLSMRMDNTKILKEAVVNEPYLATSMLKAVEAFIGNTNTLSAAMEDFEMMGGELKDTKAVEEYRASDSLKKAWLNAADWSEGLMATVMAIKANEAIVKGEKITFSKEWFQV